MKNQNDAQEAWYEQQVNYFNSAARYYELELLDEAEAELNKIDRAPSVDAAIVLALRLNICYRRKQWNKMAALATQLFILDECNPRWAYAHGFATAKSDSDCELNQTQQKAF
jgi:hypothetical protein